ncbi:hypothetical protein FRC15_008383 [Serendipita sp. 397]|nr:hypothetical protein FRC15_008383 [Serendipita sp. 397]
MTIRSPSPWTSCGRSFLAIHLTALYIFSFEQDYLPESHLLWVLKADEGFASSFCVLPSFPSRLLDGLILFHSYIVVDYAQQEFPLRMCSDCKSAFISQKIPRFSLQKNLF